MIRLILIFVVVMGALVAACDPTEIDPFGFDPFDAGNQRFSIYGFLEEGTSTQALRIVPLRRRFDPPGSAEEAEIDALVYTKRTGSSDSLIWSQQVVQFSDGSYGTVFSGAFQPQAGETYELIVRRSDGAVATATTTLPLDLQADVVAPTFSSSTDIVQSVYWPADGPISHVTVTYRAGVPPRPDPYRFDYGRPVMAPDGRWRVDVQLSRDAASLRDSLDYRPNELVELAEIIMLVEVLSSDWMLPNDTLSIDDLADPGRFSNIEGGYGFFGAIGYSHTNWNVPEQDGRMAGFCPYASYPCPSN